MLESFYWPAAQMWYGGGGWSISTEFFFYLLFPFLLPALMSIKNQRTLWFWLLALCVTASLPGIAYNVLQPRLSFGLQYAFPPLRLSEFTVGIITALLVFRFGFRGSTILVYVILIILFLWLSLLGPSLSGYVVHNFVLIPAVSLLLMKLAQNKHQLGALRWIGSPLCVYLGRISYSFYIAQLPLIWMLKIFLDKNKSFHSSLPIFVIMLIINILAAVLFYEFIEKPSHKWLMSIGKKYINPKVSPTIV